MLQYFRVCGEQREALIDNLVLAAELSDVAVPAHSRKAAILNECRSFAMIGHHLFKMPQRNIADTECACPACFAFPDHRRPDLSVGCTPTSSRGRTVYQIAVD